jgi:hypothetical protein
MIDVQHDPHSAYMYWFPSFFPSVNNPHSLPCRPTHTSPSTNVVAVLSVSQIPPSHRVQFCGYAVEPRDEVCSCVGVKSGAEGSMGLGFSFSLFFSLFLLGLEL